MSKSNLSVGTRIFHTHFGTGTIRGIASRGGWIFIQFDHAQYGLNWGRGNFRFNYSGTNYLRKYNVTSPDPHHLWAHENRVFKNLHWFEVSTVANDIRNLDIEED